MNGREAASFDDELHFESKEHHRHREEKKSETENWAETREILKTENWTETEERPETRNWTETEERPETGNWTESRERSETGNWTETGERLETENWIETEERPEARNWIETGERAETGNWTKSRERSETGNWTETGERLETKNWTETEERPEARNWTETGERLETENWTETGERAETGNDQEAAKGSEKKGKTESDKKLKTDVVILSKLDEISKSDVEKEQWQASEKITALAEIYARKEEVHRMLYDGFVVDIAMEKLNKLVGEMKIQSHKKWAAYIKDSVFLEAIHKEEFLVRLTNKVCQLRFRPETIKMISGVLRREILGQSLGKKKLRMVLRRKAFSGWRKRLIKVAAVFILAYFLIQQSFTEQHKLKEQAQMKALRSPKKIEAYIQKKYHITSDVSSSDTFGLYESLPTDERHIQYFAAETREEGVPDRFQLEWKKSSTKYEDIRDDLEYETVYMYALNYQLTMDNLSPSQNIIRDQSPQENFEPKFLDFLSALKKSKYVQAGYPIEIKVQNNFNSSEQVSVTVVRNDGINAKEISAELKKLESHKSALDLSAENK